MPSLLLLLLLFPVKPSPTMQPSWSRQEQPASEASSPAPGQWESSSYRRRREQKERRGGMPLSIEGKVGILICFGNFKKFLDASAPQSAYIGELSEREAWEWGCSTGGCSHTPLAKSWIHLCPEPCHHSRSSSCTDKPLPSFQSWVVLACSKPCSQI